MQVYVTELYESRFAICFNSLFNAEIQLLCAVGLSNTGKVHARSSRSGNMPLTRRHALPCRVGLGTIQSKLYISHPLPHSSQIDRKKYLQCSAMEIRICLDFVLQKWRPTKRHGYLSSPQKFLPVWLPQAWSVYYSPHDNQKQEVPHYGRNWHNEWCRLAANHTNFRQRLQQYIYRVVLKTLCKVTKPKLLC